ncbi:MAG: ABC transporter transmembrane domain-containing protein [Bacteroidia bacterium]|nr:ABC transporter transmembrane domain-containing protein [Bacteroidia bacterium]MDW8334007.1 ABC transporter transmembrane domain-containing protein [Bacteroidia bacterium]
MARKYAQDDAPKGKLDRAGLDELRRLYRYLRPYRVKVVLGLTFMLLSGLTTLAFPYAIGRMVDTALGGGASSSFLRDEASVAVALLTLLVFQAAFSFFRILWFNEVGEKAVADLRKQLFDRLVAAPMAFFHQRRVGELTSRLGADATLIFDALTFTLAEIIRSLINLLVGVAIIFATSVKLTLVMLSTFPAIVLAAAVFGRKIRRMSRESQDALAESNAAAEEALQGIQTVKSFANEARERRRYRQALDEAVRLALRGAAYRGAFASFVIFAIFGAIIFILWYGATMVRAGEMSVGQLTSFLVYTMFVGAAFASFGEQYSQVQRAVGATERIRRLLEEPVEDVEPAPEAPSVSAPGRIEFCDVRFAYPSRPDVQVLKGVSFVVHAGEKVALVGPSGAGKSTVVALVQRFFDPDSGTIRFNDADIKTMPLHQLRRRIAVVPQDVFLFAGTIRENIAYGRPEASDDEIRAAAALAYADEFIEKLPDGYETVVGERGVKLSGGQRQRVAIARAALRDPQLLILDEATGALDAQSERWVQAALDRLMQRRTTLVIAHRLSTVRNAHRILVLQNGKIVESGTHDELMLFTDGVYRMLAKHQLI